MFIRTESFKEFTRSYPIVTVLVAINLFLWVIIDLFRLNIGMQAYQWGAGVNLLIGQGEYWRLITPIFLHAGLTHVLFNSFSLVLFGPPLEQMLGKTKFIFAYLFTGIAGNFFTFIINPDAYFSHVGASGAIYGFFGIYLFMVLNRKHLIDSANAKIVMTILIIGLIMTFIRPNINIYGHLFGLIGGFALAPLVLNKVKPFSVYRTKRQPRSGSIQFDPNRWNKNRVTGRKVTRTIVWVIIGGLVLLGLFGRLF